jgi:hypothetical protein
MTTAPGSLLASARRAPFQLSRFLQVHPDVAHCPTLAAVILGAVGEDRAAARRATDSGAPVDGAGVDRVVGPAQDQIGIGRQGRIDRRAQRIGPGRSVRQQHQAGSEGERQAERKEA